MSKIFIWETLSNIGGGQQMSLKIADILSDYHELHFLIPEEGELSAQLNNRNISYTLMGDQSMPQGKKGLKGLVKFAYLTVKAAIKGRREVRKYRPDIIYAAGPASLAWSVLCARRGVKVIWHLHHIFQSGLTLKLINLFSGLKCVKRIIAVSDYVGAQIKKEKAKPKMITIYNPIRLNSDGIQRKNLAEEIPLLNRELKVAQIGFITPTKKQDVSIEVINNLVHRGFDACLAIIGSVQEGDEAYKEMLSEKVKSYSLESNVVFTGFRTDIDEILNTFDVLFIPSVEGFSLVALQALSENVPLLSVETSGCTELVKNTSCGMIYSPDSKVDVIADTLVKTAKIDVKSEKEKHPDFLLSRCSYESFVSDIVKVFSL